MTDFDFGVIWTSLPFLWEGLQLSLWLTFLAVIGGIVLGTLLALARLVRYPAIWPLIAAGYVNLIRSVPLILVIFWFYFLVPLVFGSPGRQFLLGPDRVCSCLRPPITPRLCAPAFKASPRVRSLQGNRLGSEYWQIQRHMSSCPKRSET